MLGGIVCGCGDDPPQASSIFLYIYMIPARGPQTKLKGNHDRQAIGSWARYLGLGTQAEADDEQS